MQKTFSVYLLTYVLAMGALALLFGFPKAELHLLLNSCHTPAADTFFRYYSTLAEWPFYVIGLLPLCFKRWRWTVFFGLSEGVGALLVQIVKRIFRAPRPVVFFEDYPDVTLPLVEGVRMHHSNSFPSGHTNSFFIFYTVCALLLAWHYGRKGRSAVWGLTLLPLLAMAFLGGYSRIYLSQHFFLDTYVGSLIGMATPCLMFWFFKDKIVCKR